MIYADEALERLREGNRRFVSDVRSHENLTNEARRSALASGQEPFAIILGCSDSRVPAEIVFDQGLGDLFDLVQGRAGRSGETAITVFKNGGGAHLDLIVARLVCDRLGI